MTMRKAVDVLFEVLKDEGVDKIFGNPGSTEMPLMDALVGNTDFSYVLGLQEATAVGMADGYAQATGRPSFVNLHTAGGLGNGMGAIISARATRTPLVVTAGQQDTRHLVSEPWLSGNLVSLASPAVKWAAEVNRAADLGPMLRRAFAIADTHPKGPVFLSIPMDILSAPCEGEAPPRYGRVKEGPAPVDALAALIAQANGSSTALLVSDTVARSNAVSEAIQVADAWPCRVFGTPLSACNNFPTEHRAWRGMLPPDYAEMQQVLAPYETILYVGDHALLAYPYTDAHPIPLGSTVVQFCQDRHYAGFNLPGGQVLAGDLPATLSALASQLRRTERTADIEQLELERADLRAASAAALESKRGQSPIHCIEAANEVLRLLPKGTRLVNEASSTFEAVRTYAHFSADDEYYFVKGGGLGWGMPAAVGIALHDPLRPVACFIGDGASMYSPQALWSAGSTGANVKFIIFNNRKYDILMRVAKSLGFPQALASQFVGMTIDKPAVDFRALADTFSLPYSSADTISDLTSAVPLLFEHSGPAVLEVRISGL